jgi:hypothetical protein
VFLFFLAFKGFGSGQFWILEMGNWEIGKFSSNRLNFNPSIFKLFLNTKVNLALNKFPNLPISHFQN